MADWRDLDPDGFLASFALGKAATELTLAEKGGCPCVQPFGIGTPAPWPPSKSLRRDLQQTRARLAGRGRIEEHLADDATFAADFLELVRLHTAQWAAVGDPGIFGAPWQRRFFERAFAGLSSAGLLRLITVRVDGHGVAAAAGFSHQNRYYHFITGYDPSWTGVSLGSLAVEAAARQAQVEGATRFDFLRGREGYKHRWGARDRATLRRWVRV